MCGYFFLHTCLCVCMCVCVCVCVESTIKYTVLACLRHCFFLSIYRSYFTKAWTNYLTSRCILDGKSEPVFPEPFGFRERDQFYKSISFSGWGGSSGHDAPMIAYVFSELEPLFSLLGCQSLVTRQLEDLLVCVLWIFVQGKVSFGL